MIFKFPTMHGLSINPSLLLALLLMLPASLNAQEPLSDTQLLAVRISPGPPSQPERISLMPAGNQGTLARFNPIGISLSGMMYVYQRFVSPQMPSECLYHTSCSAFSKQLIRDHGLLKGVLSTADRLMRCHRLAALDVHPMHIHEVSGKVEENTSMYKRHWP